MRYSLLLLAVACSPTVSGKSLAPGVANKRVAVTGKGYTQGAENALMQLGGSRFKLMSRAEQKAIAKEKELQYGGDFSDDQVVSLGKQMGAELLFVVKDDVQRQESHEQPMLENCAFNFGESSVDTPEQKANKAKERDKCEKRNEDERKRAAAAPPRVYHRYKINVRAVDITTGEVLGYGDADVMDGQAGMTCVYPCTREKASDLAIRAILGLPTN